MTRTILTAVCVPVAILFLIGLCIVAAVEICTAATIDKAEEMADGILKPEGKTV